MMTSIWAGISRMVERFPTIPGGIIVIYFGFCACALAADLPPRPFSSFDTAKEIARDTIFADRPTDYYCGCTYTPTGKSGGKIDASQCGYTPRKNPTRGKILEWEHVVPAWFFGHNRACWKAGHDRCVTSAGKKYAGRECCAKVDTKFKRIEADLHNLVPSVGELNGDRSNLPYGLVDGEPRLYGACNFEIGGNPRVAEPPENVRGDVARIWFYMSETYGIRVSPSMTEMFRQWSEADPVDAFERTRNERVFETQGNRNHFVE